MLRDESTLSLLARCRAGDAEALNALAARLLPRMRRWASGRLPRWARDLSDTDDIVQQALLSTLKAVHRFTPRHEAAFAVYLRQALSTRILNEQRRAGRRPMSSSTDALDSAASSSPEPLAALIERERIDAYERALCRLSERHRQAIIGRLELNYSYAELAEAWATSPDAARKVVERAVLRLALMLR